MAYKAEDYYQAGNHLYPISKDGSCPKCSRDDVIPGLDAIYCYSCQKSFPTLIGVEDGWRSVKKK